MTSAYKIWTTEAEACRSINLQVQVQEPSVVEAKRPLPLRYVTLIMLSTKQMHNDMINKIVICLCVLLIE